MPDEFITANLSTFLASIKRRGKSPKAAKLNDVIEQLIISAPPSKGKFLIDHTPLQQESETAEPQKLKVEAKQ